MCGGETATNRPKKPKNIKNLLATRKRKAPRGRRAGPQFRMATNIFLLKTLLRTSLGALCTGFFCGHSIAEFDFSSISPLDNQPAGAKVVAVQTLRDVPKPNPTNSIIL